MFTYWVEGIHADQINFAYFKETFGIANLRKKKLKHTFPVITEFRLELELHIVMKLI